MLTRMTFFKSLIAAPFVRLFGRGKPKPKITWFWHDINRSSVVGFCGKTTVLIYDVLPNLHFCKVKVERGFLEITHYGLPTLDAAKARAEELVIALEGMIR